MLYCFLLCFLNLSLFVLNVLSRIRNVCLRWVLLVWCVILLCVCCCKRCVWWWWRCVLILLLMVKDDVVVVLIDVWWCCMCDEMMIDDIMCGWWCLWWCRCCESWVWSIRVDWLRRRANVDGRRASERRFCMLEWMMGCRIRVIVGIWNWFGCWCGCCGWCFWLGDGFMIVNEGWRVIGVDKRRWRRTWRVRGRCVRVCGCCCCFVGCVWEIVMGRILMMLLCWGVGSVCDVVDFAVKGAWRVVIADRVGKRLVWCWCIKLFSLCVWVDLIMCMIIWCFRLCVKVWKKLLCVSFCFYGENGCATIFAFRARRISSLN